MHELEKVARLEKEHRPYDPGLQGKVAGLLGSPRLLMAAALVHELIEARDEKRLLRFQKQLAKYKLLIIDELGFVPLSKTGAELLFEVFSQRYEGGSTLVPGPPIYRSMSGPRCSVPSA